MIKATVKDNIRDFLGETVLAHVVLEIIIFYRLTLVYSILERSVRERENMDLGRW
jgi:hypothetical protein